MTKLLEFKEIKYSVGTGNHHINVSGALEPGGILNVSGPSGSGKTTLLRILARLRPSEGGTVWLEGTSWKDFSPVKWRRKVHYLAQKPALFDGTVRDNLMKPFELAAVKQEVEPDMNYARELMERLFLSGELLEQDARTLSGGEASRIALIRSLLLKPELLLLDEPLAALDSKTAEAAVGVIGSWRKSEKRGVIMVSHVGEFSHLSDLTQIEIQRKEDEAVE